MENIFWLRRHIYGIFYEEKTNTIISFWWSTKYSMHCMLSYLEGYPILYVSHDEDDGMWQFLCGSNHNIEDASIVSLFEVYNIDYSICLLKDMPRGYYAIREM